MKENNLIERSLMGEKEFKEYLQKNHKDIRKEFYDNDTLNLITYDGVNKFKSIRRAIKRSHASLEGVVYPKKPFHNKANTCKRKGHHSRDTNERKKYIYEQFRFKGILGKI